MPYTVLVTHHASRDLEELYGYIALSDAPAQAEQVLAQIEKVFGSLSETPQRGTYPRELLSIGIREYRGLFFKPYRIVYRVVGRNSTSS